MDPFNEVVPQCWALYRRMDITGEFLNAPGAVERCGESSHESDQPGGHTPAAQAPTTQTPAGQGQDDDGSRRGATPRSRRPALFSGKTAPR